MTCLGVKALLFLLFLEGPSVKPGMGAIPYNGGVTFRVWTPFATKVHVTGTFNNWSPTAHPLYPENDGTWSVDVTGAKAGDKYQFVIANGSKTYWRNDPRARKVTSSAGYSVVHGTSFDWGQENFSTPHWNKKVIYEMHIGTFNDQPGGGPGTFASAIQKLDSLKELGINAVNLMGCMEFAGDFSWGYNPAYPYAVETAYGGPVGLKQFVKEAHKRGIAVILDVTYNHFGPSDLLGGLWQFDGWNQSGLGGVYFYNNWKAYTMWGATRPDYGRGQVRVYIRDNARMWLDEYRLDGLRIDSTVNIRTVNNGFGGDIPEGWSLMQWVNNEVDKVGPWKLMIAEDMHSSSWITKDTGAGGAGFDAQWDASFVHTVRGQIVPHNDLWRNMYAVRDAIYHRFNTDAFERIIYTESHDEVANGRSRVAEEIWPGNAGSWYSKKRSTLGAALVFTSPGIPMIFQGQEILEDGWFQDSDPLDWAKLTTYGGIRHLYRDLIRLRRNGDNNTRGLQGQHVNVHHINDGNKVIAFHRWENGGPGDDVVIVMNFSGSAYWDYTVGFPRGGLWWVRFNSDWGGYSPDFTNFYSYDTVASWGQKDGIPYHGNISIAPYSAIILSQ